MSSSTTFILSLYATVPVLGACTPETERTDDEVTATQPSGLQTSQAGLIAAGDTFSCAVVTGGCGPTDGGSIKCWGLNGSGQVGAGKTSGQLTLALTPVYVSNGPNSTVPLTGAVSVFAGPGHACAIMNDDSVRCWGTNSYGELGAGTSSAFENGPVQVNGIDGVIQVGIGLGFTCALDDSGQVYCWGTNYHGELGQGMNGPATMDHTPHPVPLHVDLPPAWSIAVGNSHVCALTTDGLYCWGRGDDGQTALTGYLLDPQSCDGYSAYNQYFVWPTPTRSPRSSRMLSISAGYAHTCAVISDGTAKCWGRNFTGQLGMGSVPPSQIRTWCPTTVVTSSKGGALGSVRQIGAGDGHSCAVLMNGSVKCWGSKSRGQLGNGTIGTATDPYSAALVTVLGADSAPLTSAAALAAGSFHNCALLADLGVRCFGADGHAELGDAPQPWLGPDKSLAVSPLNLPVPAEVCNQIDDDGDGQIDECNVCDIAQ